jgi:ribosomal-protein-alanine N-acetyltransferase
MSDSSKYFLETARLGFRPWTPNDLPIAMALWGDLEVTRYIGGPFSQEVVEEKLRKEIAWMNDENVQYWPIFQLSDQAHVGCCGLRPYKPEERIYEMGFHLRPAFWGKGLAMEAGRAIVNFAFQSRGAESLFAGRHPANTASQKVLEKLGFRFTHEEFYPPTGTNQCCYLLRRS